MCIHVLSGKDSSRSFSRYFGIEALFAFAFSLSETVKHVFSIVKYSKLLAKSDKLLSSYCTLCWGFCLCVFWLVNKKSGANAL
jgi:hypothetical protein